jgi:hypothetical protein
MIQKISFSILASVFLVTVSFADEIPPFSATCTDKMVKAYRYSIDVRGNTTYDGWSEGEKFQSGWHFRYNGGNIILLDDKPFPIIGRRGSCFVFYDGVEAPFGVGIWVYAINLKLKKIVAAQVQAGHGILDGIKTRSVCLGCTFKFDE